MGWLSGWNYRKKITVQYANIDSDLTWFPLYVDITADNDIGGHVSDSTNGYDIRFTKTDGTTLLKYEREYFNVTTGTATGDFWVSADGWVLNNASGTDLYIYYNDGDGTVDGESAADVWDANFKGVYHLNESAGDILDSSGNSNTLTSQGTLPNQDTGKIYKGQHLDGSSDYGYTATALVTAAPMTISAWVNLDQLPFAFGDEMMVFFIGASVNDYWHLRALDDDGAEYVQFSVKQSGGYSAANTSTEVTAGVWEYWVAREVAANNRAVYLNMGGKGTNATSRVPVSVDQNFLGRYINSNDYLDGVVDEVRISDVARSEDWLKFEYYNINEGDNELTWGAETTETPVTWIPQVIMIT
jgi:hypothetical protein